MTGVRRATATRVSNLSLLSLRPAAPLEPVRAVLPVVDHERAAGRRRQRADRASAEEVALDRLRDQPGAGDRRDYRARGAVMAALPENPDTPADRVVLDDLKPGMSCSCTHCDASSLDGLIGLYARDVEARRTISRRIDGRRGDARARARMLRAPAAGHRRDGHQCT